MKSQTINNIEELIQFLRVNYNSISEDEYTEIIKQSLDLYTTTKPEKVETAVNDILNMYEIIKEYPRERPLFLHDVGQYDFVDELKAKTGLDWNKLFKD